VGQVVALGGVQREAELTLEAPQVVLHEVRVCAEEAQGAARGRGAERFSACVRGRESSFQKGRKRTRRICAHRSRQVPIAHECTVGVGVLVRGDGVTFVQVNGL
jgi:hypothetical protein